MPVEPHDLPRRVRPELGRVGPVERPRRVQVLLDLKEVLEDRVVRSIVRGQPVPRRVEVAHELVAADVVDRLLHGAVLVDLPREELVEEVVVVARRRLVQREPLRKVLRGAPRRPVVRALRHVVERAVRPAVPIRVRLLVLLQVIPPHVDDAPVERDLRREDAGGDVREQPEIASHHRRIEAPQPRVRLHRLVLVELRIEAHVAVPRPVRREEDPPAGAVHGADVVERLGLVRDALHARRLVLAEAGDLVDLPVKRAEIVLRRPASHHREDGALAVPVHVRLAHGDAVGGVFPDARLLG